MDFNKFLDNELENMISTLDRLVNIPSVGTTQVGDAPFGTEALAALKEVVDIAKEFGLKAYIYDNRVAIIDLYPEPTPVIGILAHADVVPAGNGWAYDPFKVTQVGDTLYGRGVIDNKGPIVSALYAMKYILDNNTKLSQNVRLIVGSDEERGSSDLSYYIARQQLPQYVFTPDANYPVINTEKGRATGLFAKATAYPDNASQKVLSAKGGTVINAVPDRAYATVQGYTFEELDNALDQITSTAEFELIAQENDLIDIVVYGRSAHASLPETGENAVTALCEFLSILDAQWESVINASPHGDIYGTALGIESEDEISGKLTYSFDLLEYEGQTIKGTFDIRFPICLSKEQLQEMLKEGFSKYDLEFIKYSACNPHHTDKNSILVKTLLEVYEKVTGEKGRPLAVGGGTYAHGIPGAVAFGPEIEGVDNKIHGADEFITIDHFKMNTKMMYNAIVMLTKSFEI